MSATVESEIDTMQCCASCGTVGGDDIKLNDCDDCDLVKYCSDECQEDHRPQHEEECKKRAAELKDEILFKQPESTHFEDCPICCLPVPIDQKKSGFYSCCSTQICKGCSYAKTERELEESLEQKCPFCRMTLPDTDEEYNRRMMKRVEANDPGAVRRFGMKRYQEGDYVTSFEYCRRAAALGDMEAHYWLSVLYHYGEGVEKDEKKQLHHTEQAAIGGHPFARYNLGWIENENGRIDRAVKHYIIAANLGFDHSLERVKILYKDGHVSKEDFAAALRGHHAAIKATKSPQREEAYANDLIKQAASMSM